MQAQVEDSVQAEIAKAQSLRVITGGKAKKHRPDSVDDRNSEEQK
jgi:hypothetical protein